MISDNVYVKWIALAIYLYSAFTYSSYVPSQMTCNLYIINLYNIVDDLFLHAMA